jgi:uncharacterized phage protein gp47/JayE
MARLSFSDLLASVSLAEWKQAIIGVANSVGLKTTNWSEGGFTRTLLALFANLYTTGGDVVRIVAASGFLDTAEDAWLTFLARNVFGVERVEATYAAAPASLELTNGGGGLFVYDAGDIVVAHEDTGATYRNTTGGTLNPGVGQKLLLDLAAEEPGTNSNASIGKIRVMVTTSLGVTCNNVVALAGLDGETDALLRQRCRDSVAALAIGGIKNAYEYYAKSAKRADGTPVGVTRVLVATPLGDGTVDVYIAGVNGALSSTDVAYVQADFDKYVTPYGFSATAISAVNLSVSAPASIWIPSSLGLDTASAQKAVHDALRDYVQSLPIGGVIISPATGKVYWRALLSVVASAIPGTLKAQLVTEADINVATNRVPVWVGVLAHTTVHQVA